MGEKEPADTRTQTPKYTQAPAIRLKLKKLPCLELNPAGNPNSSFSRIHSQWDLSPPAGTGGFAAPCPNYHWPKEQTNIPGCLETGAQCIPF